MFPKARVALTSLAVLFALLCVVTVAYAAMYIIDTNNANVAEWTTQGIAVFQTDSAGDYGTATADIVNVWVARSITNTNRISPTLNFLLQTNSTNALATANNAVLAILDCDMDSAANDPEDRVLAYVRTGSGFVVGDSVYLSSGNFNGYATPGLSSTENDNLGQGVGGYVEWGVPLDDLVFSDTLPPDYCQGPVNIRFATGLINATFSGFTFTTYDQTPAFTGYNVPTAVRLESLEASVHPANAAAIGIRLGTLAAVGVVGIVVTRSRRRS